MNFEGKYFIRANRRCKCGFWKTIFKGLQSTKPWYVEGYLFKDMQSTKFMDLCGQFFQGQKDKYVLKLFFKVLLVVRKSLNV